MESKTTVKIKDEAVNVSPQLLFQRLVTAGTRCGNLEAIFKYKLCSYPPAMFGSPQMMRPANKASLADSIWCPTIENSPKHPNKVHFVLDGGALLHLIPWTKGTYWETIPKMYTGYVTQGYGAPTVVFDGYLDSPSTKDNTHAKRRRGCIGSTVHISDTQQLLQMTKEEFLSNTENKQRFIYMLGARLEANECEVHNAKGDADLLVVEVAVACADRTETVVIADDTDILCLLVHHTGKVRHNIWFQPNPSRESSKAKRCWNISATPSECGLCEHSVCSCHSR